MSLIIALIVANGKEPASITHLYNEIHIPFLAALVWKINTELPSTAVYMHREVYSVH